MDDAWLSTLAPGVVQISFEMRRTFLGDESPWSSGSGSTLSSGIDRFLEGPNTVNGLRFAPDA